jgi:23S rRNA (adenine1618-N6)-methyltransferase
MKKKASPREKPQLHPRNQHRGRYDFTQLIESCSELAPFVKLNIYQDLSIDFFDPEAVKMLNKALLKKYYQIAHWDIPENYLCPPIPGRADYIHHIADLLGRHNQGKIPRGSKIQCLDIGVGANCIYPLIGNHEFGWSFIGADIDPIAIASANKIITENPILQGNIEIRWQKNATDIFQGIILPNERIDLSLCNPPFHTSLAEARAGTQRKIKNLTGKKTNQPVLNFGGQQNELWCEGGEGRFVEEMIHQSKQFEKSCLWFSTLIAKEANLKHVYQTLKKLAAVDVITIPMGQGNKISRIVAWTFQQKEQQQKWMNSRWNNAISS